MLSPPTLLRWLHDEVVAEFIADTGLKPLEVPPRFAYAQGSYGGIPVELHTRRYHGSSFSEFTVATMLEAFPSNQTEPSRAAPLIRSLTLHGVPKKGMPQPILGVDLVSNEHGMPLIALDLSPVDLDFHAAQCEALLLAVRIAAEPGVIHRKWPQFAQSTYSSLALIAGTRPEGAEYAIAAATLLLRGAKPIYARAISADAAPGQLIEYEKRRATWLEAQRQNRKELDALSRIFGADFSSRYHNEFLFAPLPAHDF